MLNANHIPPSPSIRCEKQQQQHKTEKVIDAETMRRQHESPDQAAIKERKRNLIFRRQNKLCLFSSSLLFI